MVFDEQKRFFTAAVLNQGKGVGLDPRAITFVYEYNARMYVNMGSLIKKEHLTHTSAFFDSSSRTLPTGRMSFQLFYFS